MKKYMREVKIGAGGRWKSNLTVSLALVFKIWSKCQNNKIFGQIVNNRGILIRDPCGDACGDQKKNL